MALAARFCILIIQSARINFCKLNADQYGTNKKEQKGQNHFR